MKKRILLLIMVISLLGNGVLVYYLMKNEVDMGGGISNPQYEAYLGEFKLNTFQTNCDILFVGDSITARGLWNEFFPMQDILNRGIGSDTTAGVKKRLDEVIYRNPKKIFLMIGINDLANGVENAEIVKNIKAILDDLSRETSAEIYLQSLLPCETVDEKDISAINEQYELLSNQYKNVTYINLIDEFLLNGEMNQDLFSTDGVHLNGDGYKKWIDILQIYVSDEEQ